MATGSIMDVVESGPTLTFVAGSYGMVSLGEDFNLKSGAGQYCALTFKNKLEVDLTWLIVTDYVQQ